MSRLAWVARIDPKVGALTMATQAVACIVAAATVSPLWVAVAALNATAGGLWLKIAHDERTER